MTITPSFTLAEAKVSARQQCVQEGPEQSTKSTASQQYAISY